MCVRVCKYWVCIVTTVLTVCSCIYQGFLWFCSELVVFVQQYSLPDGGASFKFSISCTLLLQAGGTRHLITDVRTCIICKVSHVYLCSVEILQCSSFLTAVRYLETHQAWLQNPVSVFLCCLDRIWNLLHQFSHQHLDWSLTEIQLQQSNSFMHGFYICVFGVWKALCFFFVCLFFQAHLKKWQSLSYAWK